MTENNLGQRNDLIVWNHGSISLIRPVSTEGEDWLRSTAPEDAQFLGDAMAVEWRYVADVVAAAREAGLIVN